MWLNLLNPFCTTGNITFSFVFIKISGLIKNVMCIKFHDGFIINKRINICSEYYLLTDCIILKISMQEFNWYV